MKTALKLTFVGLTFILTTTGIAQKPPAFDVATIKPGKDLGGFGMGWFPGPRLITRDTTVKDLIRMAYSPLWSSHMPIYYGGKNGGGPSWIDGAHFDIEAKAEQAHSTEENNRKMLQTLLADRFHLKLHHETRELPIYILTLASGGPNLKRMKPSSNTPPPAQEPAPTPAFGSRMPAVRTDGNWRGIRGVGTRPMNAGELAAQHEPMNQFVTLLQIFPEVEEHDVLDKTGLTGDYDFTLQWTPIQLPTGAPPPDPSWPSLFTALQEQLGLKLEVTKGPVDVIVIDSVERPDEN